MILEDLIRAVRDRVWKRARWHGFYLYEVTAEHSTKLENGAHDLAKERLSLRKVGDIQGLPDLPRVEKRYGMAGQFETLTAGDRVLVGFEGGSPARPYIAFRVPTTPTDVLIDADSFVQIGTTDPDRPSKRVYVGSKNRKKVARDGDLVGSGVIQFIGGSGVVTIKYLTYDGTLKDIGTIAAPSLVFTPGVNGPFLGVQGDIDATTELFESE